MTRLIFIILFFLVSLLAIFRAFAYPLWLLAIGVTEYWWVFALITILLLLTGFWVSKYQLAGTVIGIIALLLYLSPIFRAYIVSSDLKQQLSSAFGGNETNNPGKPYSFFRMFEKNPEVKYQTLTYIKYADTN